MLVNSAEASFKKGLRALNVGRRREALALFEAAIKLERRYQLSHPQPRYLSYYGLCLALETDRVRDAVQLCREAVAIEGYNPDIRCNLGRVLMRAGRRREAYDSFVSSLRLQANHRGSRRALKMMGLRQRPMIPFLARSNPLNVLLGRMRVA